ncbi:hypothetical protein BDN72DRAFT_846424 [Pluteus cervinus]|uniref:Uncharacterized protein n=1 Tax=Pluteus cervinus TaxID=181527 RepID=A0ACD3AGV7_9AGAR|nr:hypothetical protein BDN72DRAFT_846424 [Pluteus cervinus]
MFPLSCLGHFPCIVQVNQGYTGSNWEEDDSFASHKFLSLHHETLQCLILKMLDPLCFPYLWFTPSSDPLPKLSTIHLELKNPGVHGRSAWQTLDTLPKFTPFIDTLTTLSLVGTVSILRRPRAPSSGTSQRNIIWAKRHHPKIPLRRFILQP